MNPRNARQHPAQGNERAIIIWRALLRSVGTLLCHRLCVRRCTMADPTAARAEIGDYKDGAIQEIVLTNFMTHGHAVITPGPRYVCTDPHHLQHRLCCMPTPSHSPVHPLSAV